MKKKIFGIALIAIMALAAGWNFTQSKNEVKLSELALANVEALAHYEFPDVEVTCGATTGACWVRDLSSPGYNCGEYTMVYPCKFSGSTSDHCIFPC